MRFSSILLAVFISTISFADSGSNPVPPAVAEIPLTLVGKSAMELMQALKLAGAKETVVTHENGKSSYSISEESVHCHSVSGGVLATDLLDQFDCTISETAGSAGINVTEAQASLLYEALVGAELRVDAGMSQTQVYARKINCVSDSSLYSARKSPFQCSFVGIRATE